MIVFSFILFADLKNQTINKKIIKSLKSHNKTKKYIFSSVKPNHKKFEEKRYWRGPVWINCNWIIYQGLKNKDKNFANKIKVSEKIKIKSIIKKLKKYHEWLIKYRDPKNTGLVSILHPWESGYDNSPLWDYSMNEVKVEKNLKYKRGDNKVINPEYRPLDSDYDRYVTIKNHLRKNNYNPNKLFKASLFNVVDVGFNSIFLRANKDLVKLLKMFDLKSNEIETYISRSEKKIVKLYNKKNNSFINIDLKNKKKLTIPSITHYFILFADLRDKKLNNKIIKNLKKHSNQEKYFFSSIKSNHRKFEEKRYWRGPVWINCNWIIYQGLKNKDNRFANQIKKKTIDLVKQKGFNEYFSCKTGKGFGATNFSWTASLFLDLILENKYE